MEFQSWLDNLPLGVILLICFGMMIGALELGYKLGSGILGAGKKAQLAQVRAIMGASLGLLAFMLAFSFSIAQSHFELRTQAYMQEVSAIRSTYASSGQLDDAKDNLAKSLVREFVDSRLLLSKALETNQISEVGRLIGRAEEILMQLWHLTESRDEDGSAFDNALFSQSVMAMADANSDRKQAALYNRISPVIWLALLLMSVLSMLIMGYQAGLTGTPSRLATWTLALTFAAVMTLVTDLDRPRMTLFSMNQQQMEQLGQFINKDIKNR